MKKNSRAFYPLACTGLSISPSCGGGAPWDPRERREKEVEGNKAERLSVEHHGRVEGQLSAVRGRQRSRLGEKGTRY